MAIAIVPARLASSRFPEKVLRADTGRPLVQHAVDAAARAEGVDRVVVAADDERIAAALEPLGTEVILTGEHPNGTSRLAEAASLLGLGPDDVVVNVQGDEPEIEPLVIDAAINALRNAPEGVDVATVGSPFAAGEDPAEPNIVKVVRAASGLALYFSRARVPWDRDGDARLRLGNEGAPLKHVGLYVYRVRALQRYVTLEPTPLEQTERLEQLRLLEHGLPIAVAVASASHHGIDTEAQYLAFVERFHANAG
jgi:3-deoxy-manno-octulosonate cytidylyltransferase (CMP-KDO synthetase)